MEPKMNPYVVYVKLDDQNRIIDINSSAFLSDASEWVEVARGFGDKFHHAQGNYLSRPIRDHRGIPNFEYHNGAVFLRSEQEMDQDYTPPETVPTFEERLKLMEEGFNKLTELLKKLNLIK